MVVISITTAVLCAHYERCKKQTKRTNIEPNFPTVDNVFQFVDIFDQKQIFSPESERVLNFLGLFSKLEYVSKITFFSNAGIRLRTM